MYLTKTNYIILFFLLCVFYYYIMNCNIFEKFENEEGNTIPGNNHPFIRTDYNELDKPYNSEIHKNLLYNEQDNIKSKYGQATLRTTGMMNRH
jgi:hypothetical protein